MLNKSIILATLITIICSETFQNFQEMRIPDFNLNLPNIPSPYFFSTKQMNLQAIGNNLNPQITNSQQITKPDDKAKDNITQPVHQESKRKQNQRNSSLKTSEQINLPVANISQNATSTKLGELAVTKKQQNEGYKAQFQKIDLKKLMQEIEKEEQNKKVNAKNQSQKIYQSLFGPIKNQQIDNSSKIAVQQSIKNNSSNLNKSNKGQFKDHTGDKDLTLFKQAQNDKKQLDFQSEIPKINQKQAQKVTNDKQLQKNQQKSRQQQNDKVKISKNRYESQLMEKQAYKQQYEKLLKQVQQLKDNHKVQEQKVPKIEENHQLQKRDDKPEQIFCLSLKITIILASLILLMGIYCLWKKQKNSRIKDRYFLQDDQKIPSDQMD